MKKLLMISVLAMGALICKAQSSIFCVQVNCPLTITTPQDSILVFGQATINSGSVNKDSVILYQWKQVSGPSSSVIVTPTSSQSIVRKLVPGTYIYSLTATTRKGQVGIADNAVVTVIPAPVVIPRNTMIGGTIKLVNGQLIFYPTYSDGKP